jgi:hypothetical protein
VTPRALEIRLILQRPTEPIVRMLNRLIEDVGDGMSCSTHVRDGHR